MALEKINEGWNFADRPIINKRGADGIFIRE